METTKREEMMDWEITLERYFNFKEKKFNRVPIGHFCYEDITPSLRYYCEYCVDGKCNLFGKNVFDWIKVCNVNYNYPGYKIETSN